VFSKIKTFYFFSFGLQIVTKVIVKMPPRKKSKVDSKASTSREEEDVPSGDSDQETGTSNRKKQKPKANGTEKVLQNKTSTDFHNQDFTNGSTTVDGKSWNLKIASWNGIYIKFF